jgi:hypothetical protein
LHDQIHGRFAANIPQQPGNLKVNPPYGKVQKKFNFSEKVELLLVWP